MKKKTISLDFFGKPVRMIVFDYSHYQKLYTEQNFDDESVGLDIISYCLEMDKCWEPFQTEITREILLENPNGTFIDMGCQLGYYSMLAAVLGNKTISVDFCSYFLECFRSTIKENHLSDFIEIVQDKIDDNFQIEKIIRPDASIQLVKVDIEGAESFVVDLLLPFLQKQLIPNLILEISPKLNDSYVGLSKTISDCGYHIFDIGLSPQRALEMNTSHLKELEKYKVEAENVEEYIPKIQYGQTNFLFRKKI